MNTEFELLAPAGSFEILKAVIEAGADAVYVGGSSFGARAYANNFQQEELLEAIDYVHLRGKKLFLTVNTLLKNSEIDGLYEYLLPYYERGLDAVIVQDFGVLTFIRKYFPDLPIHTSTQMTITGQEGAKMMKELGASRVVLARELSIAEMKHIHKEVGVELEAFVHGALCYSYSGQCLFSSLLGGRSGNRGRCAQPCRLSYGVLNERKKEYKKDSYILSLKDLCGIEYLRELRNAGVYSLKIEGRMKQASYAAGVVSFYRKYIDLEKQVSKEDFKHLYELGNRSGFTTEYFHKHNDKSMVTFTKPSYEKSNEALHQEIEKKYVGVKNQIPISGTLLLQKGQPMEFYVHTMQVSNKDKLVKSKKYRDGNFMDCQEEVYVSLSLGEVQAAQKKPLTESDVCERMKKTGESPFYFQELDIHMDTDVFVPNGVLNQIRRDALEKLEKELLKGFLRQKTPMLLEKSEKNSNQRKVPTLICACETRKQFEVLVKAEQVAVLYVDAQMYNKAEFQSVSVDSESISDKETSMTFQKISTLRKDIDTAHQEGKQIFLRLPVICRKTTMDFYKSIQKELQSCGLDGVVVRNYEELYFVQKELENLSFVIDYNLYTYNDYAKEAFWNYTKKQFPSGKHLDEVCNVSDTTKSISTSLIRDTIPLELNRKEIQARNNTGSEMVIYGRYPLMVSAGCVHKNAAECDKKSQLTYLKDRYQVLFPVKNYCGDCYNIVYNSVPVLLIQEWEQLQKCGVSYFRLEFTMETAEETKNILYLLQGKGREIEFTKGHYKRGVE